MFALQIPESRVSAMDAMFAQYENAPPEVISRGSDWGKLHELLGRNLAQQGTPFSLSNSSESRIWRELVLTGGFSRDTLENSVPLAYAVDPAWVAKLEESAALENTWLHKLLLAVAYAEAGQIERPIQLLLQAREHHPHELVERCLAVLQSDTDAAWVHFSAAWELSKNATGHDRQQLRINLADELLHFLLGLLPPDWTKSGRVPQGDQWLGRLRQISSDAVRMIGAEGSDTIILSRIVILTIDGSFDVAIDLLASQCFPTLGRGRDVLVTLWQRCVEGKEAVSLGKSSLSPREAHKARRGAPVPRNIGCPYATLYCEQYW